MKRLKGAGLFLLYLSCAFRPGLQDSDEYKSFKALSVNVSLGKESYIELEPIRLLVHAENPADHEIKAPPSLFDHTVLQVWIAPPGEDFQTYQPIGIPFGSHPYGFIKLPSG